MTSRRFALKVASVVGLIQKVLLDMVEAVGGSDAVAEVKTRAGVEPERRFRMDTVYADDEWRRLLEAACAVLGVSEDAALDVYAKHFLRDARARWPIWFEMSQSARQFLLRQPTIHNTFATGVRDADARRGIRDKFRLEELERELVAHYRSPNELCGLYKALAREVLQHYSEQAAIEEPRCTKRGDDECEIHIRWAGS